MNYVLFSYSESFSYSETMDTNRVNTQKDIEYIFHYSKWLLKPLGLWWMLSDTHNKIYKYLSFFLILFNTLLISFLVVPSCIYVVFSEKNLLRRIILFGPICFSFTSCVKYHLMIIRVRIIYQCFEHIKYDWKIMISETDRQKMYKYVKFGRNFMIFCIGFMYTGGLSYNTVMPFLTNSGEVIGNKTRRPHVYYGYDYIFDSQATPNYEIVFFVHVFGSVVTYTMTTAACNLAVVSASHICGQVDIIHSLLQNLIAENNDLSIDEIKKQTDFVVRLHIRILRFAAHTEKMLREICLVEILANTLIICFLEYYIMMEWNNSETFALITYLMLLISLNCNIFIFCYIGEILQERCASIGKSTYMIDWYKLPGKSGLSLLLIIAMANYPLKITAGGLIDLNLQSFGKVIKTSLAYLNMLRTVAE